MISNVKFNELEKRVDLLVEKVLTLELQIKSLTDSQGEKSLRVWLPCLLWPLSSVSQPKRLKNWRRTSA